MDSPKESSGPAVVALALGAAALIVAVAGLSVGVEGVTAHTEVALFTLSAEVTVLSGALALCAMWVSWLRPTPTTLLWVLLAGAVLIGVGTVVALVATDFSLPAAAGGVLVLLVAGLALLARRASGPRPRPRPVEPKMARRRAAPDRVGQWLAITAILLALAGMAIALAVAAVRAPDSGKRGRAGATASALVTVRAFTREERVELRGLVERLRGSDNSSDVGLAAFLTGALAVGIAPVALLTSAQGFARTGTALAGQAIGFLGRAIGRGVGSGRFSVSSDVTFSPTIDIKRLKLSLGGLRLGGLHLNIAPRRVIRRRTTRTIIRYRCCPQKKLPCTR